MLFARHQQAIPAPTPQGRRRTPMQPSAVSPKFWHHRAAACTITPNTNNHPLDLEALALAAGSEYEDSWRTTRWRGGANNACNSGSSCYSPSYSSRSSTKSSCGYGGSGGGASGLPLVCSNCGASFFSLQITDDELECYCSGECKWSAVMYREMDRRMHVLRRHLHAAANAATVTTAVLTIAKDTAATLSPPQQSSLSPSASSRSSAATTDTASCSGSYKRDSDDDVIACR